jgi:hypothetical protein
MYHNRGSLKYMNPRSKFFLDPHACIMQHVRTSYSRAPLAPELVIGAMIERDN